MLFSPEDIPLEDFINRIKAVSEVKNIHHVHIWQLNEDEVHMEAHVDFNNDIKISSFDKILEEIESIAHEFGINHINIQPEYEKPDDKKLIVQH